MGNTILFVRRTLVVCVTLFIAACGSGSSGAGGTGSYSSVGDEGLVFDFKPGGVVTMTAKAMNVSSSGTYTVDGDKFVVTMDGQQHTFIRDGKCIEEGRHIFGRLCEGGKAGAASNVSTRKPPVTDGVWVSKSADGDFKIEFKPGNRLTLTGTPPGGRPDTANGTFIVDGDRVSLRLPNGMPIILQFVNDVYETTSFGMPMKFTRQ